MTNSLDTPARPQSNWQINRTIIVIFIFSIMLCGILHYLATPLYLPYLSHYHTTPLPPYPTFSCTYTSPPHYLRLSHYPATQLLHYLMHYLPTPHFLDMHYLNTSLPHYLSHYFTLILYSGSCVKETKVAVDYQTTILPGVASECIVTYISTHKWLD